MRKLLFLLGICLSVVCGAQPDAVLMRINGKEISRAEFEESYAAYCSSPSSARLRVTPEQYLKVFVDHKLKVAAAETAGIDTLPEFRNRMENYRRGLSERYLVDEDSKEEWAYSLYKKMKSHAPLQVCISQIFRGLPQTLPARHIEEEKLRMDSIYKAISAHPGIPFPVWLSRYSEKKDSCWITPLQVTKEMEDVVFSLREGEVSQPFFTPEGLHIVKVIKRKSLPPFEEIREGLVLKERSSALAAPVEKTVQRLKEEYNFKIYPDALEDLKRRGETDLPLFSLDGRDYTGALFKLFAASHPKALSQQFDDFVVKTLLDYENQSLEKKYVPFRHSLRKKREDMLLSEIMRRKVLLPGSTDKAGLATYFKFHKADYQWETPRYRGIVLHSKDKKTARRAKKLVKKLPFSQWKVVLIEAFNTPDAENVKVEAGVFAQGDNKYIDKLVYKKNGFEPLKSFPFTTVIGEKQKGPDDYKEVLNALVKDYQNYLETDWLKELRSESKVEINQEVLKTVNNL